MNNYISTNGKEVKFCFSPPIGPNKIVQQENKNILDEIVALPEKSLESRENSRNKKKL